MSETLTESPAWRVARRVREIDLESYQRTFRRLLAEPLVVGDREFLAARCAVGSPSYAEDLANVGGYTLEFGAVGARLAKRPLVLSVHQPVRSTADVRVGRLIRGQTPTSRSFSPAC